MSGPSTWRGQSERLRAAVLRPGHVQHQPPALSEVGLRSACARADQRHRPVSDRAARRAELPADSVSEPVAYAKANPRKVNYASQGNGQFSHLTFEAMKSPAGLDMVHIPFRGSAPAITALLGSQADVLADPLLATMQHVQSGGLKLLGVGSPQRLDAFRIHRRWKRPVRACNR